MATSEDQQQETATTAAPPEPQPEQPLPPIPTPILTLPNCLIRAYHPQDAERMAVAANSPDIARYMRNTFPSPYTLDSARQMIELASAPASGSPRLHFGIFSPDGQLHLGGIGLKPGRDVECRTYEVGYWITPAAWGRGLATAALTAFSRWVFETFPEVLRLAACVYGNNDRSCRVLVKVGFVHEGTRRRAVWKNGEVLDLKEYGLLREECLGDGV